jgi:hypothetical protein
MFSFPGPVRVLKPAQYDHSRHCGLFSPYPRPPSVSRENSGTVLTISQTLRYAPRTEEFRVIANGGSYGRKNLKAVRLLTVLQTIPRQLVSLSAHYSMEPKQLSKHENLPLYSSLRQLLRRRDVDVRN